MTELPSTGYTTRLEEIPWLPDYGYTTLKFLLHESFAGDRRYKTIPIGILK